MEPLSSAAVVIASLIVTKAFEKTGEKLGEVFTDRLGKFVNLIKGRALPKTQTVQINPEAASYAGAVEELELAARSDTELNTAIQALAQTVESDPALLEKVRNTAILIRNEPSIIQNQAKLAEKIGLVVQGGEVNIANFSF